jgi:hypothetical protein
MIGYIIIGGRGIFPQTPNSFYFHRCGPLDHTYGLIKSGLLGRFSSLTIIISNHLMESEFNLISPEFLVSHLRPFL